jgi:hypothetical protein
MDFSLQCQEANEAEVITSDLNSKLTLDGTKHDQLLLAWSLVILVT